MLQTPWEYRYAHRMQSMGSSVIRELLKLTEQPDIISFAGGLPAPEVFPVKEFQEACNVVLLEQRRAGAAVQHHRGLPPAARDDRPSHRALQRRRSRPRTS